MSTWNTARLGEVCSLITDGTHFSPTSKVGPYKYITSKNIRFGKLDLTDVNYISEVEHQEIYRGCPVQYGDILLTKDGANTGNAAINTLQEPFSLLSSVALIRADNQSAINGYLLQYILSPMGQIVVKNSMAGQAITRLTLQKIKALSIPLPPLAEQRKIAAILGTWDAAIATAERLVAALKARKKALMQRLLTGEVRFPGFAESQDNKQLMGKIIPSDWVILSFSELVEREGRTFNPEKSEMILPCLELEHIESETGHILGKTTTATQRSVKNVFSAGDVIFGKLRPYLRKFALPNFDGVCSSEFWVLRGKKDVCRSDFLFYLVQSHEFISAANASSGTKMPRADWSYVSNFAFTIPRENEEQRKVAGIIRLQDQAIDQYQGYIEQLISQKRGLMQRLLTGEVRVAVDD